MQLCAMERRIVNFTEPGMPITETSGASASIFVFGPIGSWWGANKNSVISALRGKTFSNINVYISSPGGELPEAINMAELLVSTSATVTAYLIGTCASAATVIASRADRVVMSRTCVYMIHRPEFSYTGGTSEDLRKSADLLDLNEGIMLDVYAGKTGMDKKKIAKLLRQETWMGPDEALEMGFVDEIVDRIEIDWTAPLNGMPMPWESWLYDNADTETTFNGQKAFTSTIVNLIDRGFTQYENKPEPQNLTIMNLAQKVIDFLVGKGHIPADQSEAAQASLNELDVIEAVQASARAEFAEVTNEQVISALRGLTAELRAELFPVADSTETAETGEGQTDEIAQLQEQIAHLQEQIGELQQAATASAAKRPVPVAKTNGKPNLTPAETGNATIPVAQLQLALKALEMKQITSATFLSMTGMTQEQAIAAIKG